MMPKNHFENHYKYYDGSKFEKEEHNLFPSKNILLDWIIWYDSYNHKLGMLFILMGTGSNKKNVSLNKLHM